MSSSSLRLSSLFLPSLFRHSRTPIPPPLHLRYRCCSSTSAAAVAAEDASSALRHPWPEWVTFVDKLKTRGYFGQIENNTDDGVYREMDLLKEPCLGFARDRYDIFKSLSVKEIETVVGRGCPNLFRKVVNSAKRLRAYAHLDEGDVCSACDLRGSCDRAYVILKEPEAVARTVDLVRVLLIFALDPLVISGGQRPPGRELVEASARKLISELIELSEKPGNMALPKHPATVSRQKLQTRKTDFVDDSQHVESQDVEMKRGDWMCPKCNFMNFAKNFRCLRCNEDGPKKVGEAVGMKKGDWICPQCNFMNFSRNVRCLECKAEGPKRIEVDDVVMKKGDWICPECNFVNFASNKSCLRCQGQRPKRQLNPGEWECPSCNFLNFRRNVACLKCKHERPKETENVSEEQIWKSPV